MEQEAKALAQHKAPPAQSAERGPLPALTKPGQEDRPRLPAGTPLKVITTQSLSTRSASTGENWTGKLVDDLKDEKGRVVAKAGSNVKGRIMLVSDGSNIRRKHEIEIRVSQIETVSGRALEVRSTSYTKEGEDGGRKPAIIENQLKIDFQLASSVEIP